MKISKSTGLILLLITISVLVFIIIKTNQKEAAIEEKEVVEIKEKEVIVKEETVLPQPILKNNNKNIDIESNKKIPTQEGNIDNYIGVLTEENKKEILKSVEDQCKNIENQNELLKSNCEKSSIKEIANTNKNENICELINNEFDKQSCYSELYIKIALNAQDPKPEYCEKILNNEQKEACFNESYFYLAAFDRENTSMYCEKITSNLKKKCLDKFIK